MDTEEIEAYTFQDKKGVSSDHKVRKGDDSTYHVELPKTLASILRITEKDSIKWRLKSKNELILDSK